MGEVQIKTKKWGSSIGLIIPKKVVDEIGIKLNDVVRLDIKKPVKVRDVFGMFPNWKRNTQEIKDELRTGWMSASDLAKEKRKK